MNSKSAEQRRKTIRYPAVSYRAEVKRLRGFARFAQPFAAEIIDYHSDGIGLFCEERFAVGDKVVLSISSASEHVSNIHGVVRYVKYRRNGYWFGVQFAYKVKGKTVDQSVLQKLEKIMAARFA